MMPQTENDIEQLRAMLANCSTETKRLITDDVLALPAIRYMLLVFLKDTSRPFEDWIMEPKCRHRLTQLRERIDSQDVPALTASYEENVAVAVHERLRSSTITATPVPVTGGYENAFQVWDPPSAVSERQDNFGDPATATADPAPLSEDSTTAVTSSASTAPGGDYEARDEDPYGDDDEEAYNMLLVMSEAMKEEAKGRFSRGDFMGAAKAYMRAAATLDERQPPPPGQDSRHDALRKRLADLYVTCMCNAAVAGFKAASAAPAPGSAHSLVVDACSRALERSGGKCPKARFWRARVKVSQRMYEAAENDLLKAVQEEEEERASSSEAQPNGFRGEEGKGSREQTVLGVHGRSGNNPDDDAADASNTGDSYCGSPSKTKISNDSPPPIAAAAANAKGHAPTSNGSTTAEAAEEGTNPAASERQPRTPPASSSSPFSSEAVRWLARVRAKIAQMNADRAKACAQSSVREEIAAKARQKTLERNQRRLRHGPGHVPRRAPPGTRGDGGGVATAGEGGAESPVGRREEGNGFRLKEEEEGDGDDFVWRVPKPPVLKVADKSPAMVMNDYSMKAKFQISPEFEQIAGDEGQTEYVCRIAIGPEERVEGLGRASNMKAARQEACRTLLKNAALAWNVENPDDPIDMETMEVAPYLSAKKQQKALDIDITEEFKAYVAAWVDKVVLNEIHEACFAPELEKEQRKYVHSVLDKLGNPAVLSKSITVQGRRRLSVMRREMMEGHAFMSGDQVVVVDVPKFPTVPADIPDMATITRPPPERNLAELASSSLKKKDKMKAKGDDEKHVKNETTGVK